MSYNIGMFCKSIYVMNQDKILNHLLIGLRLPDSEQSIV